MPSLLASATGELGQLQQSLLTAKNVAIGLSSLLILYFITQAIYDIYFHPLAKFPGPAAAKVSRLWLTWQCLKGQEPYVLYELSKKYG